MKKAILIVLKVTLILISIPFLIIPAICFGLLLLLESWGDKSPDIIKHTNMLHRGKIK